MLWFDIVTLWPCMILVNEFNVTGLKLMVLRTQHAAAFDSLILHYLHFMNGTCHIQCWLLIML